MKERGLQKDKDIKETEEGKEEKKIQIGFNAFSLI